MNKLEHDKSPQPAALLTQFKKLSVNDISSKNLSEKSYKPSSNTKSSAVTNTLKTTYPNVYNASNNIKPEYQPTGQVQYKQMLTPQLQRSQFQTTDNQRLQAEHHKLMKQIHHQQQHGLSCPQNVYYPFNNNPYL